MWNIKFTEQALKSLKKIDNTSQKRINNFVVNKLLKQQDPRKFGKPLSGRYLDFWCYRVGNYRLICNIEDKNLTIMALNIGHRKEVYKKEISH